MKYLIAAIAAYVFLTAIANKQPTVENNLFAPRIQFGSDGGAP